MKIKIHVTREILERSAMCGIAKETRHIATNCAISLAVRDIFLDAQVDHFDGGELQICVGRRPNHVFIKLPEDAHCFVGEFDYARPHERATMKPLSFDIDVPYRLVEMIGIGEVYRILSESRTLELVAP